MHVRTRSQKPVLALGLEHHRRRRKLPKVIEVIDKVEERREDHKNVGGACDYLVEELKKEACGNIRTQKYPDWRF